jgi:2-dehydropantoate 2-reductase
MGSVYAGLMADAGHEVFAVTLWPDHAQAMRDNGLRVEGASGDRLVRVRASTGTDGIGPCDLVVIATKAFDVEAAARSTLPLLGPETVVQTIQNGLGSAERVASVVGPERLAVGVAGGFGASMRGPGHVHHNGMEMVRFGAYGGLPTQLLQASAEIWRSAGFNVKLFQDIDRMVWEKLIMNVTFSGTSALTGLTVGEIMADPHAWTVARGCAEEAIAVAAAKRIALQVGDPIEHIRHLGGRIADRPPVHAPRSPGWPAVGDRRDQRLDSACRRRCRPLRPRERDRRGSRETPRGRIRGIRSEPSLWCWRPSPFRSPAARERPALRSAIGP